MSAQHSGLRVQLASLNANAKLESDALPEFERWLIPTCGEDETSGFATAPTPPRLKPSAMCVGPREAPDLYAVGFQELGALSAALAGCTETLRASVDREIRRTLRVHQATVRPDRMYDPLEMGGGPENYALIAEVVHGGIVLFVYARERPPQVVAAHRKEVRSAAERIREVRTTQVGTGIFDVMGNKGAVGARVRVASSTPGAEDEVYTFVCAHLAAHDHNVQRRNADWRSIAERLVFSHKQLGYIPSVLPRNLGGDPSATIAQVQSVPTKTVAEHQSSALDEKEYSLYDTHRLFVMGDLNYRISANSVGVNPADGTSDPSKFPPLNKRDIKSMLASKDPERWTWLLPYDQLIAQRAHTPPLAFQELCVPDMNRWRIPPTYKYIIPASSKQGADILNPKL
ncbi:hypothetical protein MVES_000418 [Malassezia vespertilionis]|uniref:Inositol polyphosphate-related phosphatase domain-containing protein n=1 Tax=Malassezia vespertilionis TaxID=2020962 RepID=A0A2N1JHI2_9BASI|nr:hypothetical protein MVES_000418 [Malassezia vespertilionis]